MICRAKGCSDSAMPNGRLCGFHDEALEDGEEIEYKQSSPGNKRLNLTDEEKAERWLRARASSRNHKRRVHGSLSRRPPTPKGETIQDLAAKYDSKRSRERASRVGLKYQPVSVQKEAARQAVAEVRDSRGAE